MASSVSVVIPVYNASAYLTRCLTAIQALDPHPLECIVVDDASTDDSYRIASRSEAIVLRHEQRRGPAAARNLGARAARGDILLFLDADVVASPDCVARVAALLTREPQCDAVIGSYDDQPGSPDFISQYRHLLHAFMHQTGGETVGWFWTGCGAMRASVFHRHGGFAESIERPKMEDVELGLRLRQAGSIIRLDKQLLVQHLKHLTFAEMLWTDLAGRALPWSRMILRFHSMPPDLNLRWGQRASVALACASVIALPAAPLLIALMIVLNHRFYRYLSTRRGVWFAVRAIPMHFFYFLCSGAGFATALVLHCVQRERRAPEASSECAGAD